MKFNLLFVLAVCLVGCAGAVEPDRVTNGLTNDEPGTPYRFEKLIDAAQVAAREGAWPAQTIPAKDAQSAALPEALVSMLYEGFVDITFREDQAVQLAGDDGYSLEGFHRGWLYDHPVHIEVVEQGVSRPWRYRAEAFAFGPDAPKPDAQWNKLGWAGLRINRPWQRGSDPDELLVMLGASYFRALGEGSTYGASGRLIAVNTGIPGKGESFPRVTAVWVHRASDERGPLTLDGLIDGEHLTAAFRMVVHPGTTTVIDIDLHLFTRKPIEKLGLAPITSMFMFGPEPDPRFRDERPEVHDNDGLLAHVPGKVYWQPLRNPLADRTTRLTGADTQGYGLVQRERRFQRYLDWVTRHELRPDVWVRPTNQWPKGAVELLELARLEEKVDNIGCYYAIDNVAAGESIHAAYSVSFGSPIAALHATHGQPTETSKSKRVNADEKVLGPTGKIDLQRLGRAERVVFARTPWPHWSIIFDGPQLRGTYADKPFSTIATDRYGNKVFVSVSKLPDERWCVHLSEDLEYPVDVHFEDYGKLLTETVRLQEPNP